MTGWLSVSCVLDVFPLLSPFTPLPDPLPSRLLPGDQVVQSAGPQCAAILANITRCVEQQLASSPEARQAVKHLFAAATVEHDGDFLFLLADAAVFAEAFAAYVRDLFFAHFGSAPSDYHRHALANTSLAAPSASQSAPHAAASRTCGALHALPLHSCYWQGLCTAVYGEHRALFPDVDATNTFFGGTAIASSRIYFTNGSQDPWKRASLLVGNIYADSESCIGSADSESCIGSADSESCIGSADSESCIGSADSESCIGSADSESCIGSADSESCIGSADSESCIGSADSESCIGSADSESCIGSADSESCIGSADSESCIGSADSESCIGSADSESCIGSAYSIVLVTVLAS
ncbi:unnamed protein product [Closterium sp. Naga37s-1]|nr:unnamed protein product [Closterium sp. Naga37s-1]